MRRKPQAVGCGGQWAATAPKGPAAPGRCGSCRLLVVLSLHPQHPAQMAGTDLMFMNTSVCMYVFT